MFAEMLAEVLRAQATVKGFGGRTTQLKKYIFTLFGRKSRSSKTFYAEFAATSLQIFLRTKNPRLKSTYFIRLFSDIKVSAKNLG